MDYEYPYVSNRHARKTTGCWHRVKAATATRILTACGARIHYAHAVGAPTVDPRKHRVCLLCFRDRH